MWGLTVPRYIFIIILKNQNMSQFISNKIKEEKDNLLILALEF